MHVITGGSWKRVLIVGCSHGTYIDNNSKQAVLIASKKWRPHLIVHLGDWCDATALRSGASGTPDEFSPISPDIDGGLHFIYVLRQHCERMLVFDGNHEARILRFARSSKALASEVGTQLLSRIEKTFHNLKIERVPYRGLWETRRLGNFTLMHGVGTGGANALRQHVNSYGNVVIAHIHTAQMECSTRNDGSVGFSTGTLADIEKLEYANNRFNTLRWSAGFVWGEYNNNYASLWLNKKPKTGP